MISRPGMVLLAVAGTALACATVGAQTDDSAKKEKPWRNSTDLSLVSTEGNSKTSTFGFNNSFSWTWDKARFRWKIDATRTDKADDRFLQINAGVTWEPGETPPQDSPTTLVEPASESDVQLFLTEMRYDRQFRERFAWNAGASWDRNVDAGILSRAIVFGGLTNVFWEKKDELEFNISYGFSYTDREEENPDPMKDDQFAGVRFTWDYLNKWGSVTTYENALTTNVSLADPSDYFVNMTNAISVSMSKKLAIRVSLQWLYNAEPALEDVDVVARVELIDPDGVPGNGDEFFITVDSGGSEVEVGEDQVRKKELDTIFRTSLVITF